MNAVFDDAVTQRLIKRLVPHDNVTERQTFRRVTDAQGPNDGIDEVPIEAQANADGTPPNRFVRRFKSGHLGRCEPADL